jgi:hypothetical protein
LIRLLKNLLTTSHQKSFGRVLGFWTVELNEADSVSYLKELVAEGEHWYIALLKTMARWSQAEETVGERRYRYLIGGEAFDWLLLAERLVDALDGAISPPEREALLFHGHPPLQMDEDEFQQLLGTPKYQAHLNYLYGVVVEEALQLAVEEEIAKEHHGHVWSASHADGSPAFERIYGRTQTELLREFLKERGLEATDSLEMTELKEFTYWLFKYRVRTADGARVASDTRKGLVALSRVEMAFRKRLAPEPIETAEPLEASSQIA